MQFPCLKIRHADGTETFEPLSAAEQFGVPTRDGRHMAEGRISSCQGIGGTWLYRYTAEDAKRDAAEEMYDALIQIVQGLTPDSRGLTIIRRDEAVLLADNAVAKAEKR